MYHKGKMKQMCFLVVYRSTELQRKLTPPYMYFSSVLPTSDIIDALQDVRIVLSLKVIKTWFVLTCDSLFAIDSERELFSCKQQVQCNNVHMHILYNLFLMNSYKNMYIIL